VTGWFQSGKKLLNECAIVYRDEKGVLQNRRPDRVIQEGDKITVVDFKFGKERKEHLSQVREYVSLLQQMGYPDTQGYLWYVEEGRIETF